jgi:hypothetical protein
MIARNLTPAGHSGRIGQDAAPEAFRGAAANHCRAGKRLDPMAAKNYTPPMIRKPGQESRNAVFGRSRRWGPHPAKGEAT